MRTTSGTVAGTARRGCPLRARLAPGLTTPIRTPGRRAAPAPGRAAGVPRAGSKGPGPGSGAGPTACARPQWRLAPAFDRWGAEGGHRLTWTGSRGRGGAARGRDRSGAASSRRRSGCPGSGGCRASASTSSSRSCGCIASGSSSRRPGRARRRSWQAGPRSPTTRSRGIAPRAPTAAKRRSWDTSRLPSRAATSGLPRGWKSVEDAAAAIESLPATNILLIVDDFHTLTGSPAEAAFERFVDYAPPTLAVLTGSRTVAGLQPLAATGLRRAPGARRRRPAVSLVGGGAAVPRLLRRRAPPGRARAAGPEDGGLGGRPPALPSRHARQATR